MSKTEVAERPAVGASLLKKQGKKPKFKDLGRSLSERHRGIVDLAKDTFRYLNDARLSEAESYYEVVDALKAMRADYINSPDKDDSVVGVNIDEFMTNYQVR